MGSDIKEYVKSVSIEGKIASIGFKAFENCQNLTVKIEKGNKFKDDIIKVIKSSGVKFEVI